MSPRSAAASPGAIGRVPAEAIDGSGRVRGPSVRADGGSRGESHHGWIPRAPTLQSVLAMTQRLALAVALAAVLAPAALRRTLETPPERPGCAPAGRGVPPRHWLGCAADPGPSRALAPDERLALGLPIDPNTAGVRELAHVPGLSRKLAEAVVRSRQEEGPFLAIDDLLRVRGIGPKRLAQARPALAVITP